VLTRPHRRDGGDSKMRLRRKCRHDQMTSDQTTNAGMPCHHKPQDRYAAPITGGKSNAAMRQMGRRNAASPTGRRTNDRHATAQMPLKAVSCLVFILGSCGRRLTTKAQRRWRDGAAAAHAAAVTAHRRSLERMVRRCGFCHLARGMMSDCSLA
jgi:hypothetical protein